MGVIQGFASPWQAATRGKLDIAAASLFLRAQASWLCRGLGRFDDHNAVGIVLGGHDASHESWLSLIAAVDRCCGEQSAQEVAALYGFHGRVVGSLERGLDRRLGPEVAGQVRAVLSERLCDLTETAIKALNEADLEPSMEAVRG